MKESPYDYDINKFFNLHLDKEIEYPQPRRKNTLVTKNADTISVDILASQFYQYFNNLKQKNSDNDMTHK